MNPSKSTKWRGVHRYYPKMEKNFNHKKNSPIKAWIKEWKESPILISWIVKNFKDLKVMSSLTLICLILLPNSRILIHSICELTLCFRSIKKLRKNIKPNCLPNLNKLPLSIVNHVKHIGWSLRAWISILLSHH